MKNFTLIICCLLAPLITFSQEMGAKKKVQEQQIETQISAAEVGNEEEMMKQWMELISLGDEHKVMAEDVGTYNYIMTYWSQPGAEPMKSEGKCIVESIMEGRYLIEKHQGETMGMPFHGMSILGYDKLEKAYVSTWIDNMGTGIMKFTGKRNEHGAIVSTTTALNPMTGQHENHRVVTTDQEKGWIMDYFISNVDDGSEFQSMQIVYQREN